MHRAVEYRSVTDYSSKIKFVNVVCLMPYGITVTMDVAWNTTLMHLKEDLLSSASKHSSFKRLASAASYGFVGLVPNVEELNEENEKIIDLNLMFPHQFYSILLKLVERPLMVGKDNLLYQIDKLTGRKCREILRENEEVIHLNCRAIKLRKNRETPIDIYGKIKYFYPMRVSEVPTHFTVSTLNKNMTKLSVEIYLSDQYPTTYEISINDKPRELLTKILRREICDDILKVCGYEEFVFGDYKLINFDYVREKILLMEKPKFVLMKVNDIKLKEIEFEENLLQEEEKILVNREPSPIKADSLSWNICEYFKCFLEDLTSFSDKDSQVGVQAGLYCGKSLIGNVCDLNFNARFNHNILEFGVIISKLPRMTKLCLAIYEIKSGCSHKPVAWANTMIFDYKGFLKNKESISLSLWMFKPSERTSDSSQNFLKPLETVEKNPENEFLINLKIENCWKSNIIYPDEKFIYKKILDIPLPVYELNTSTMKFSTLNGYLDDKQVLPVLIEGVDCTNHFDIIELTHTLGSIPSIPVDLALKYLDRTYTNESIRGLAVRSLQCLKNEDLVLLLIQIVEALKNECYLYSPLAEFLLERAINCNHFFNHFYWYLSSECHNPEVRNRFSILMEILLKNAISQVSVIYKQYKCINKFRDACEIAKKEKLSEVKGFLNSNTDIFSGMVNPLNTLEKVRAIDTTKLLVMNSKMKPMIVTFDNIDLFGHPIKFLFKSGDDLRQDMFALQMIKVMDFIWKSSNKDFSITNYGCLTMGNKIGVIECVEATTIAKIQRDFGRTTACFKTLLLNWLKEHNRTPDALKLAIGEFTKSALGYCVATYVLGVADRHSDNIMIKQNGQMFHIDFGHILGNFKYKGPIKRERVPFILSKDFIDVINEGKHQTETQNFNTFRTNCTMAYRVIREQRGTLLTLCSSAISAGLPELTMEDLNYLKETLAWDKSDEEATQHFIDKFNESVKNNLGPAFNDWFHNWCQ